MALQTAEPQQLTHLAVLAAGGEALPTGGAYNPVNWSRGEEAIRISKDLRSIRPEGGKHALERALAVKSGEVLFNLHNSKNFINRFGGEHAGAPTKMTAIEIAPARKAEDLISQNTELLLFLQAKNMSEAAGARNTYVSKMLTEYGVSVISYDELRKHALESIANSSTFISMFPEIQESFTYPPTPGILTFIENTLMPANDHRLEARLGTRIHEAYKKAVELPLVGSDEERVETVKQIKLSEETIKVKRKQIEDILKAKNIKKIGGANFNSADIDAIISTGGTPDMIGNTLVQQAYLQSTPGALLADFDGMKTFADLPRQISEANARITAKLTGTETLVSYKATHTGDPDVMDERACTMSRLGYLSKYGPSGTKNVQYVNFSKNFLPLLEQNSLSAVGKEMRQAQLDLGDAKIKKGILPPTTADVERSRDLRLLAEEDLLGEMDGILGQSIKDVISDRYDVMEERMGRVMDEKAKQSEKDMALNIDWLKRKMSKNWIEYNQSMRKKEIHKEHIKKDVTHLAYSYDKDMALKQLLARDMFAGKSGNRVTESNFSRINLISGVVAGSATPVLNETQLAQVNEAFEKVGTEYRDKLFADMFAARTFFDRNINMFGKDVWTGALGFKQDEWKYMMQRYEPDITKALEANQEASQALKTLEQQGVKINFKMKWLWYMLAIVFGGLTGGGTMAALGINSMGAIGTGAALGGVAEGLVARVPLNKDFTDVNGNTARIQ